MHIQTHKLYPQIFRLPTLPIHIKLLLLCMGIFLPLDAVIGSDPVAPRTQDFVLTAYYSPQAGQCCYVKGGLQADKILNGEGHTAADGTPVYMGMIAAPPGYDFGTVIELPGLGVFKVHDRGGAIQEWDNGSHRLDVWIGDGEEALARALGFGVQSVTGTIYPVGSSQPKVSFDPSVVSVNQDRLKQFLVHNNNLTAITPKEGESNLSVFMLQEHLKALGYLHTSPTGYYGKETKNAYELFLRDFHVDAPSDILSEKGGAYLLAAGKRMGTTLPLSGKVDVDTKKETVQEAQRLLRSLGFYTGKTNGSYDEKTKSAILAFQQSQKLVGTSEDPGASVIGPLTTKALYDEWNRKLVAKMAQEYITISEIDSKLSSKGIHVESFLSEGSSGNQVSVIQRILSDIGYFPEEEINGNFGPLTKKAVTDFQIDQKIIKSEHADSAGNVGPKTMVSLRKLQRQKYYNLVRAKGWQAL